MEVLSLKVEKVISICKALGATEYYNAIGGQELYSKENGCSMLSCFQQKFLLSLQLFQLLFPYALLKYKGLFVFQSLSPEGR